MINKDIVNAYLDKEFKLFQVRNSGNFIDVVFLDDANKVVRCSQTTYMDVNAAIDAAANFEFAAEKKISWDIVGTI